MNTTRTWTSILAAVAALGVAGSALAQPQPHRDDHHDDHRNDPHNDHHAGAVAVAPPAGGVAVAPPANAAVAERLHKFEEEREHERKLAVKDAKTWNAGRTERAMQRRNELASTWGNSVKSPEAQAELKTHADRMARLDRILDIANQKGDMTLATRAEKDIQSEVDHDARIMEAIRNRAGVR